MYKARLLYVKVREQQNILVTEGSHSLSSCVVMNGSQSSEFITRFLMQDNKKLDSDVAAKAESGILVES